ncbi:MAG TPA: phosphoribosylglycinamide formyltransferase [Phycisphaerae bacterium]|nr:phosphoribosylglycinamide formyltransferase [Phycisphaerae bacterium]HNU46009.1 phosphoribosylglycinamide formyltransferase [Phycisphaerae bacterium]
MRGLLRLAVLISGGGRTLLNLHERIRDGSLPARIDVVVCSRRGVAGIERARSAGLPLTVVERRCLSEEEFQQALTAAIGDVDLVCLAGFLSLWRIPPQFAGRVMNIHPALLPDFGGHGMYGQRVHEAVLAAGRTESGCTVHFCDNEYDHGPIILQRRVPVLPTDTPDTLAERVFAEECIAYPEAIRLFATARLRIERRRVVILPHEAR